MYNHKSEVSREHAAARETGPSETALGAIAGAAVMGLLVMRRALSA